MIAVDTNILIHAHREDSPWHEAAAAAIRKAAERSWAIPWPCVHEFLAIVTHARIFNPPTALDVAIGAVEGWCESPRLSLLAEDGTYLTSLADLARSAKVAGPQVHDARIAALCIAHGVVELWTADRDFARFAKLRTRNPLVPG